MYTVFRNLAINLARMAWERKFEATWMAIDPTDPDDKVGMKLAVADCSTRKHLYMLAQKRIARPKVPKPDDMEFADWMMTPDPEHTKSVQDTTLQSMTYYANGNPWVRLLRVDRLNGYNCVPHNFAVDEPAKYGPNYDGVEAVCHGGVNKLLTECISNSLCKGITVIMNAGLSYLAELAELAGQSDELYVDGDTEAYVSAGKFPKGSPLDVLGQKLRKVVAMDGVIAQVEPMTQDRPGRPRTAGMNSMYDFQGKMLLMRLVKAYGVRYCVATNQDCNLCTTLTHAEISDMTAGDPKLQADYTMWCNLPHNNGKAVVFDLLSTGFAVDPTVADGVPAKVYLDRKHPAIMIVDAGSKTPDEEACAARLLSSSPDLYELTGIQAFAIRPRVDTKQILAAKLMGVCK